MRGICSREEKCSGILCSPFFGCLVRHIFLVEKENKWTDFRWLRGFQFPMLVVGMQDSSLLQKWKSTKGRFLMLHKRALKISSGTFVRIPADNLILSLTMHCCYSGIRFSKQLIYICDRWFVQLRFSMPWDAGRWFLSQWVNHGVFLTTLQPLYRLRH